MHDPTDDLDEAREEIASPKTPRLSEDQRGAVREFQQAVSTYAADRCAGTKYALAMAVEEVRLLGLDPDRVTKYGYAFFDPLGSLEFQPPECGGPEPCEPYADDAHFKTIGLAACPTCASHHCWRAYLAWEARALPETVRRSPSEVSW